MLSKTENKAWAEPKQKIEDHKASSVHQPLELFASLNGTRPNIDIENKFLKEYWVQNIYQ